MPTSTQRTNLLRILLLGLLVFFTASCGATAIRSVTLYELLNESDLIAVIRIAKISYSQTADGLNLATAKAIVEEICWKAKSSTVRGASEITVCSIYSVQSGSDDHSSLGRFDILQSGRYLAFLKSGERSEYMILHPVGLCPISSDNYISAGWYCKSSDPSLFSLDRFLDLLQTLNPNRESFQR